MIRRIPILGNLQMVKLRFCDESPRRGGLGERMIYKEVILTFAGDDFSNCTSYPKVPRALVLITWQCHFNSVYDAVGPQITALLHVFYLLIVKREFRHVNLVSSVEGYGRTLSLLMLVRERLAYLPISFR
jgi:hypothetical protein